MKTYMVRSDGYKPFEPTHEITISGRRVQVMLVDGAAYTADEWENSLPADVERQDDGSWTFQGQPGIVTSVKAIQAD
jgi:hypothetical protein